MLHQPRNLGAIFAALSVTICCVWSKMTLCWKAKRITAAKGTTLLLARKDSRVSICRWVTKNNSACICVKCLLVSRGNYSNSIFPDFLISPWYFDILCITLHYSSSSLTSSFEPIGGPTRVASQRLRSTSQQELVLPVSSASASHVTSLGSWAPKTW